MISPVSKRRSWPVGVIAALVVLLSGCGVESLSFATPPATPPSSIPSTTIAPNYTGIPLDKVGGKTTIPQVAIGPGGATLTGTVMGPQGPVAGATVEADRIVGSSEATKQVTTAADGSWSIPRIFGGRYRVRAWQTPTLAMTDPQIFFLGGTQSMPLDLQVSSFSGQNVTSAANPVSTDVGGLISAVVSVSNQSVDNNGFVSYQPASGVTVDLTGGTNVTVTADPVTTGGSGQADFTLTCETPGTSSLTGITGTGASTTLPAIDCTIPFIPSPTSSTTTPSSTTSSSTSVPGSPTSATTAGGGP